MKPLVSVLVPVYNGESFLQRFLDSVIEQTYRPIELIVINDGSTDATENILENFLETSVTDLLSCTVITQQNKGQAAALNGALKLFTGTYLVWMDADDFLLPKSIELRVSFLEENRLYGWVMSNGFILDESVRTVGTSFPCNNLLKTARMVRHYFFYLVFLDRALVLNCGFLFRSKSFLRVNPLRDIDVSRAGQNIQMLLPMSFRYSGAYIPDCLYGRVVRKNSHFHSLDMSNPFVFRQRLFAINAVFIKTFMRMPFYSWIFIPWIWVRGCLKVMRMHLTRLG